MTDLNLRKPVGLPLLETSWLREAYEWARPRVVKRARERAAIIEVCPTSNLVIGDLPGYVAHPISDFLRDGLEVTISTDDPGLFGVTLQDEYAQVWKALAPSGAGSAGAAALATAIKAQTQQMFPFQTPAEVTEAIALLKAHWRELGLVPYEDVEAE